jgi:hypothetical protein
MEASYKTKHRSTVWSSSPLLVIYPKECNSSYYKGICTPMFITPLFTIAKQWKQPRCPNTDECIKKMWHLYTIKFYSATKKNEILSFVGKWMDLENIILSEVSQAQRSKATSFPSYADCRPKTNATILCNSGHTKGKLWKGGREQRKQMKNLNVVDVLTVQEWIQNFKLARATLGTGPRRCVEDWKRRISWSCNTHMHGNNTRKILV